MPLARRILILMVLLTTKYLFHLFYEKKKSVNVDTGNLNILILHLKIIMSKEF